MGSGGGLGIGGCGKCPRCFCCKIIGIEFVKARFCEDMDGFSFDLFFRESKFCEKRSGHVIVKDELKYRLASRILSSLDDSCGG
ncbi:unnamed protein product [Moneuplotes crassus]|uniref:Uncharacterized protein n=1 Tax=Euplotes crassus TaxID=5936 RepID=A0AAD2D314_EUPCR|nr:unnamed protein product [Moneuplotes crassus]